MAARRAGRKPMPADQRLGRSILVRLSDEQLGLLRRAAGREPIARYVRRVALRAAARAIKGE